MFKRRDPKVIFSDSAQIKTRDHPRFTTPSSLSKIQYNIILMSFIYGDGFNGVAVKFHPSDHRVAVVVKNENEDVSLIDTHTFLSTKHAATTSTIIQDINDFSWCSKPHDSLILGDEDGTIFLWNLNSSKPIKYFKEHISRITSVDFNPTDDTFITASWDKTVRLWNVDEENCKRVYEHADFVSSAKWNPREKIQHASTSFDGILRVWDVNVEHPIVTINADNSPIMSLDWNCQDPQIVTSATGENCAKVWDIRWPNDPLKILRGKHTEEVCLVKFSPLKKYQIASCSYDGKIVVWDYGPGDHDSKTTMYDDHKGVVRGLDMNKTGDGLLASTGSDGLVRTWIHIPLDM